jgi:hypothetical protein
MEHDGSFGIGSGFDAECSTCYGRQGRHSESEYPAALATEILVYSRSPLQELEHIQFQLDQFQDRARRGIDLIRIDRDGTGLGSFSGSQSSATYPTPEAMHPFSYLQSPQTTGADGTTC